MTHYLEDFSLIKDQSWSVETDSEGTVQEVYMVFKRGEVCMNVQDGQRCLLTSEDLVRVQAEVCELAKDALTERSLDD